MSDSSKKYKITSAVLSVLLVLAVIQIVSLTKQNNDLQDMLARIPLPRLNPGDSVQGFSASNAAGQEVKISYDDADYLLFITSADCAFCEKTLPSWKEIAEKAKASGSRVIAISLDKPEEIKSYAAEKNLNFEVVPFPSARLRTGYKVYGTPQTILVRRGGRVEKVWRGTLSEEAKQEISNLVS